MSVMKDVLSLVSQRISSLRRLPSRTGCRSALWPPRLCASILLGAVFLASPGLAQTPRRHHALIDAPATAPAPHEDSSGSTPTAAPAAATDPDTTPASPATDAERPIATVQIPRQSRVNIAWQIALDAADFSPGIIDGHFQRKGLMALHEFAVANFPGASPFTAASSTPCTSTRTTPSPRTALPRMTPPKSADPFPPTGTPRRVSNACALRIPRRLPG